MELSGNQRYRIELFFSSRIARNYCTNHELFQAQIVLLIILLVAIADFIIGAFIGPLDDDEFTRGYVGFNGMWNKNC